MKLVELKCKECGAQLSVKPDATDIHCAYCKANYKLDDEAVHIVVDDAEEIGYAYERGRMKARKDAERRKVLQEQEEQRRFDSVPILIGLWILFFPVMATWLIWRKLKMPLALKIALTVVLWALCIFFAVHYGLKDPDWHLGSTNEL